MVIFYRWYVDLMRISWCAKLQSRSAHPWLISRHGRPFF